MLKLILKFVSSSRAAGLRISSSEVLDCLNQLELIDVLDEPQFLSVLRANFAKSYREQKKFNRLYHLFFHELRENSGTVHLEPLSDLIQEIMETLENEYDIDSTFQAILEFLEGNPLSYLQEMRRIESEEGDRGSGAASNLGSLVRRLPVMFQLNNIQNSISQFLAGNRNRIVWEDRQALQEHFNGRLESARRLLTQHERSDEDFPGQTVSYEQRLNGLGEQSFSSLTQKEVEEMREIIEQLVRKLKDIVSLRYNRQNRGIPDIKKTLRRSARYQGIPLEIVYKNKPHRKSKIVVLCDVSSSVWSAARFMLNMLYSLQECFTRVRSFIFVAGLDEVTEIFENH